MTDKQVLLIYLSQFNLSTKKIDELLSLMEEPSIDNFVKLKNLNQLFTPDMVNEMIDRSQDRKVSMYFSSLREKCITVLTKGDENYPKKLVELPEAPYHLFCKGDLSLFEGRSISIVGSRTPTNYGRIVTERLAGELANNGFTIVSGLAHGIDSIAHRKALEVGGKTIAVLGNGFNHLYPADHAALAREVEENGLLISEYCPSVKSTRFTFPHRNRIVAGLGDGVLITEASAKSGTMHTKDYALDYGRTVFAVPGNITSEKSALTNELIRSNQCVCVTSVEDIYHELGVEAKKQDKRAFVQLDLIQQKIVDILKNGEKDIDSISLECNLNINSLNSYLTMMEISGIIKRMSGGVYMLA